MSKNILQKKKTINNNTHLREYSQYDQSYSKKNVDINKILNRVRLDQKNEIRKKFIFYFATTFIIFLIGTLITIIK